MYLQQTKSRKYEKATVVLFLMMTGLSAHPGIGTSYLQDKIN